MKRLTKLILGAVITITLSGAAVAFVIWAIATTPGIRWVLGTASHLSGVSFSAQKIEGRMTDRLLLKGVRVGLMQQKLEFDTLELRWKPLLLLSGTIAFQELVINGVRIQDDAPQNNKLPIMVWPRASRNMQLFDVIIERLQITDLSYRRLQELPVQVEYITSSITWQGAVLSISKLKAATKSGLINGTISADFNKSSLTTDLAVELTQPVAGMDRFSFLAERGSAAGSEQLVGTVTVAGSAGRRKLLEVSGDVGMAQSAFNLRRLRLTRPGHKGLITADGSLVFTATEPELSLHIKATGLDLAPELNVPTNLSGTLKFAGTLDSYRGDFYLANKSDGWQAAVVSSAYNGTREGVKLAPLTAKVLDGSMAGNMDIDWRNGFNVQGKISGKNLNPARFDPDWKGVANFRATVKMSQTGSAPLKGNISASLLESRLHGQSLTGELQAQIADNNLNISRLLLHGKGFDLQASGELNRRLVMTARVTDVSRLVPGSTGALQADGWLRWRERHLSGAAAATGSNLAYDGTKIAAASLTARSDNGTGSPLHIAASLRDVAHNGYTLNNVNFEANGTLPDHTVNVTLNSDGVEAEMAMSAGYNAGLWKGKITRLAGSDGSGPWNLAAPALFAVSASNFHLSTLTLATAGDERLEIAADLTLKPLSGEVRVQWSGLNLARANPYLSDNRIAGSNHGKARIGIKSEEQLTISGSATGSGIFTRNGQKITLEPSSVTFEGNQQGMQIGIELVESTGGRIKGTFSSSAPLRLALPEKGKLSVELSGIDLALFKPWFPDDTVITGRLSGRASGNLLAGQHFELDGTSVLSGGTLHRDSGEGGLNLAFTSATASWGWRGESLSGNISLAMAEYGQARAGFQLPFPAHLPLAVKPKGSFKAKISGKLQEKGIITALLSGLIRESFGELDTELTVDGTWEEPLLSGKLSLSRGGAYLPAAGIHIKDVQLSARLEKNLIRIDSFRALSGRGHIEGTALINTAGWRVTGYQGTMSGEDFQAVNFPELFILTTPDLRFEGTPQYFKLRGDVKITELHLYGSPAGTIITPSSDVIQEGIIVPLAKSSPMVLDVQVRIILGKNVFIKVAGIDAQLGGAMNLSLTSLENIVSSGEINVVKGRYRTYGVDLEIVRGRLFFTGGPINRPAIDFLALRTIGDVRAGVTVAGSLEKPVTKLYSEPVMQDSDILAYIVLGHPFGSSSGEQLSLVNQAAGALLTTSQARVLQDQLKSQLGLSTLEVQGSNGSASPMGYKPLQVTAPGAIPAASESGITETVLTVGKFLTPKLYISYGRSLFTGSNLFLLRYDIFKKWQIETQTGSESGADLFYKLEFK